MSQSASRKNSAGSPERLRSGVAARVAIGALAAGLSAELLLREGPWGISLPVALTLVAGLVWRFSDPELRRQRAVLLATGIVLSLVFVWRDVSMLSVAVVLAILATGVAVALPARGWLRRLDPADGLAWGRRVVFGTAVGAVPLAIREVPWSGVGSRRAPGLSEGLRGALLALPVLVPFALLFLSADAAFATLVGRMVDVPELATHLFLWGVFGWLIAGYVREVAAGRPVRAAPSALRLTGAEAAAALSLLLALFTAFVAVQIRYFFGGAELVQAVTGLTYAEYARRGFFELVTVAGLLLMVLLAADWLARDATARGRRMVRFLSLGLLATLMVILVSAMRRMLLYVEEFGLTEERFFTTAFMFWLVAVFGWYVVTVLRGRRHAFAGGLYVSAVAAVLMLAVLNPVAWIARVNLERADRELRLDEEYLGQLGGEAVPVVVAALPGLPEDTRCGLTARLVARWGGDAAADVRTWNWSRARARSLVQSHEAGWSRACPEPAASEPTPVEPAPAESRTPR